MRALGDVLTRPSTIKDLLRRHGARVSKSLGQNFLTSESIVGRIIEAAEPLSGEHVLEIGTGIGVLTAALADRAHHVHSVEVAKYLLPVIAETLGDRANVTIVHHDFVHLSARELPTHDFVVVGNLPYSVTTPILFRFLDGDFPWKRMIIMVQKEVADRIRSAPNCKTYGALSVSVQARADVTKIADVPAGMFWPQPRVSSTVLKLAPNGREVPASLRPLLRTAFSGRRKTLRNALAPALADPASELATLDIDPNRRPETLTVTEWIRLAEVGGLKKPR